MPRDEELREQYEEAKSHTRTSINLARMGVDYDERSPADRDIDRAARGIYQEQLTRFLIWLDTNGHCRYSDSEVVDYKAIVSEYIAGLK